MTLSKEQRDRLANTLTVPWGQVDLMCDGYRVTLCVLRWKSMTYRVMTYVNGIFKGVWLSPDSGAPESKFLRVSTRPNVTPARKREVEKILGKRYVKRDPFYSGTITTYMPDWSSGKAALSHLCKVCESISELPPSRDFSVAAADEEDAEHV